MKQSDGFTRPIPSLATLAAMVGSFALLAMAMRILPLGTAYMIWTDIGALGAFFVGVLIFGEQMNALRILAVLLILAGLVLMKLAAPE